MSPSLVSRTAWDEARCHLVLSPSRPGNEARCHLVLSPGRPGNEARCHLVLSPGRPGNEARCHLISFPRRPGSEARCHLVLSPGPQYERESLVIIVQVVFKTLIFIDWSRAIVVPHHGVCINHNAVFSHMLPELCD